jgi:outer membrane protein assembly factor BamD
LLLISAALGETFEEAFSNAEGLFAGGSYGEAQKAYEDTRKKCKDCGFEGELRFRIAECKFNRGDYNGCIKDLEDLRKDYQGTYIEGECLLAIGMTYLVTGALEKAEIPLLELQEFPDYMKSERLQTALGLLLFKRGKYSEVAQKLQDIELPLARFLYARSLTFLENYLDALELFRNVVAQYEGTEFNAVITYSTLENLLALRDYKGIAIEAKEFRDRHPPTYLLYPEIQYYQALAEYFLGKYDASFEKFSELAKNEEFPYTALAAYFAGCDKYKSEQYEDAVQYFQMARSEGGDALTSEMSFVRLAETHFGMGDSAQSYLTASQLATLNTQGELRGIGEYLSGVVSYAIGRYTDAADKLMLVKERYPGSAFEVPGVCMLLLSYAEEDCWDKMITLGNLYKDELAHATGLWSQYFKLIMAEAFYKTGDYAAAENLYTEVGIVAELKDIITRAQVGLGWCYIHEERHEEAEALLNSLCTIAQNDADTSLVIQSYIGLGVSLFNQGRFADGFKKFAMLSNSFPERRDVLPDIIYYQGMSAFALQSWGDALSAWEMVYTDYPESERAAHAAYRAGDIYKMAGQYEKAIVLFKWVTEHFPESHLAPRAQLAVAQNYHNLKQYEEALSECQKFLDLYPGHEQTEAARSLMEQDYYFLSNTNPEKLDEFSDKFGTSPLVAEAEFAQAAKAYEEGDKERAAELFLGFANNHPKSDKAPKALLVAGQIYFQAEDWASAAGALNKFRDFYPDNPSADTALFLLGAALHNRDEAKEAITVLNHVIDSFPESVYREQAYTYLGQSYEKTGEIKKALRAYMDVASAYESKGMTDNALRVYEYAYNIAIDPQTKGQIESRIRALGGS